MKRQAKGWFDSAHDDLVLIEEIIDHEFLTHMVAFHCQQAIEKAFKAVLEENNSLVPRVHDLITLHSQIVKYINLDIELELLKQINELYIDARYPSELGLLPEGKPPKEVSHRMYRLTQQVFETIKKRLE